MHVDQAESEQKPVPINPSAKLISQPSKVSHNFSLLWIGQAVSVIGSQFSNLTIQMVAVTILRANPTQMGFLRASQTFPYLILSLFVGVLVDRVSRRSLLLMADGVRAMALIAAAALLVQGHMTVSALCLIVCFISLFTLVFDAALGAAIPELFEPNQRLRRKQPAEAIVRVSERINRLDESGVTVRTSVVACQVSSIVMSPRQIPQNTGCVS
jgi:Na+/melibiose symporter-like transporter